MTATFPPSLVDEVVEQAGRLEERRRLLPARVVVYFVLALCLWADEGYEEVARLLVGGLKLMRRWVGAWQVPTTGALTQARARLGAAPMRALFERVARPLAAPGTPGSWWRGLRLVAIDGTTLDLPDTEANEAEFARPGSGRGEGGAGAYPQARVVGLAECGTHAVIGAAIGAYTTGETRLAEDLFGLLGEGMLLLVDRGFNGYEVFGKAQATGAHLLWRTKSNAVLPVLEQCADGSYLSRLSPPRGNTGRPITVRVVEYTLTHPSRGTAEPPIRLITTLLDPDLAPALELAALYAERWEYENTLDEIKTHQGAGKVLRSRSPEMVKQEIWGHLLVHYAVRALIYQAAEHEKLDPDRVSFLRSLRVIRRQVTDQAAFSP